MKLPNIKIDESQTNTIIDNLIRLQDTTAFDELLNNLEKTPFPHDVTVVANSLGLHRLILIKPDEFIALFSRDSAKAILYQAAVLGNLALVARLVEKLNIDITKEPVAGLNTDDQMRVDATNPFQNAIPIIEAAAQSDFMPLMQYLVPFYHPDNIPLREIDEEALKDLGKALVVAAQNNSYQIVEFLLNSGANPNATRSKGLSETAMHYAITSGNLRLTKLLLSRGAFVSKQNMNLAESLEQVDILQYFALKSINCVDNSSNLTSNVRPEIVSVEEQIVLSKYGIFAADWPSEDKPTESHLIALNS